MSRRFPLLPLILVVSGCSGAARDASSGSPGSTSALNDPLAITACTAQGDSGPSYVVSGDGRYLVYQSCAAPGTMTVIRRVDLGTKQVTDLDSIAAPVRLALVPGGAAFFSVATASGGPVPMGTLRLWSFDGSPHRDFSGATHAAFSADGTRLLTYAENPRAPFGTYGNGYQLDVRVRSLDATVDASATLQQDRGGDFTTDGFVVRGAAIAPDGSNVIFWRRTTGGPVTTRFDVPSGTITDDDIAIRGAEKVVMDAYDGSSLPYIAVDASGHRSLELGTRDAASTTLAATLLDLDDYDGVPTYTGTYCVSALGAGAIAYWSQNGGSTAPATLVAWDAHAGARTIASVANASAPAAPRTCPRVTPSGHHLLYTASSLGPAAGGAPGVAVVALASGAQPVVLDGPPRSPYGNTAFDLLVDDGHVAIVPDDTANAPATVSLLELASGNVAQVPMTPAQGSWFGSNGPLLGGGSSLLTGAGTVVMLRNALTKDASGSYVNDYHVWTVDAGSATPTPIDGGRIAVVAQNQMLAPEIFALPRSPRFVIAMPHGGQSGAYDLTLALP